MGPIGLRTLRWLMENALDRVSSEDGEEILTELDLAIEAEVEDERIAIGDAISGWTADDAVTYEDVLFARDQEEEPVHECVALDKLVNVDQSCKKCGKRITSAVRDGVIPIPICQACRFPEQDRQAMNEE